MIRGMHATLYARLKPDALLQKTTDADTVVLGVVLALGLGLGKHPITD